MAQHFMHAPLKVHKYPCYTTLPLVSTRKRVPTFLRNHSRTAVMPSVVFFSFFGTPRCCYESDWIGRDECNTDDSNALPLFRSTQPWSLSFQWRLGSNRTCCMEVSTTKMNEKCLPLHQTGKRKRLSDVHIKLDKLPLRTGESWYCMLRMTFQSC